MKILWEDKLELFLDFTHGWSTAVGFYVLGSSDERTSIIFDRK